MDHQSKSKKRKVDQIYTVEESNIVQVVLRKVAISIKSRYQQLVFSDDMKLPFERASRRYGRGIPRPDSNDHRSTTAAICCSSFECFAVLFFLQDLCSEDDLFFMLSCEDLLTSKGITDFRVIQDRAPWHSVSKHITGIENF